MRINSTSARAVAIIAQFSSWPAWLIAVVFAGLLLERRSDATFTQALRRGASSAALAWIIILGQIVIGLLVFVALVRPREPGAPACVAQLLEVSWAGGHGSSAAMGQVYASLGFPQGRDIAFFLATIGLIWGVVSGLFLVNLAIRRGWTRTGAASNPLGVNAETPLKRVPAAYATVRTEVIDPLALQLLILAAAFAVGYALQQGFLWSARLVYANDNDARFIANIPLFLFTLLGGLLVRRAMELLRIDRLIDGLSIQRLCGIAMEFLIVAAVASIRIESLRTMLIPVAALVIAGGLWCIACLLLLAPRLLPRAYWFELGLLNYGFSTANTPQGMMLLRIVDPRLESGAAEDYAVAAPLSAPFIGGGVVSLAILPHVLERVSSLWLIALLIGSMLAIYAIGRRLRRI
jgi:ESS family glutamate:Na+ symporter